MVVIYDIITIILSSYDHVIIDLQGLIGKNPAFSKQMFHTCPPIAKANDGW